MLQPQLVTVNSNVTPTTQNARDICKRQRTDNDDGDDDNDDDGSGSGEGAGSSDGEGGTKTPNPGTHLGKKARVQTQRVRKGQSDGVWRDKQDKNPHKWQVAWAGRWPWAECVPADPRKEEIHDRVRCTVCSARKGTDVVIAARAETLGTHDSSKGHHTSVELAQQQQAQLELQRLRKTGLPQLFAPGNSEAEKARLQQLRQLFFLLVRGRPITDFTATKEAFEVLGVPHTSSSHWSLFSAWELAEALDAVLMDRTRELVRGARFVSISMDECVGIDKKSRLSLHAYVMDAEWGRVPLLIDMAHLRGTPDAENITQLVLDTLSVNAGLRDSDLARKLVAVSTDGASVMTGVHNGVAARLSQVAPFTFNIHCMAHRTDLAVGALEKAPIVKHIMGTIKDVHNFFAHSAKRVSIFEDAAVEAGTAGNRIKRIVDTRWICAREPARVLLAEYRALLVLFYEEEAKLYNLLRDAHLFVAMHALMPALQSVDIFIKLCQSRELYIGELAKALQRLKDRLREMYLTPATAYTTVEFGDYKELLPVDGDISSTIWKYDPDADAEERIGLMCGGEFYPFTAGLPSTGRDRTPLPLTPERLARLIRSVQAAISAAIRLLVDDLIARFPPDALLEAFSIVYSEYWEAKPAAADFKAKLQIIKTNYCVEREGADGGKVPPLLDGEMLDSQAQLFASTMTQLATEQRVKRMRDQTERQRQAAADPEAPEARRAHRALLDDTPTSRVWQKISNAAYLASSLTEFAALAQLVFVMVPGSVEDERRFSAMGYLQDATRNRLDEHLALCVRMFTQDLFGLRSFPFEAALQKWLANSSRGRYMMNR